MAGKGILDYTTTVGVDRTVGEIMGMLAKAGARSLQVDYDQGTAVGVEFLIATQYGDRGFRLPANVPAVLEALRTAARKHEIAPRFASTDQAGRVSWRIARDWLDVQLALINAGMATLAEVMLPYLLVAPGQTAFQALQARQLLLGPGREGGENSDS